MDGTVAVVRGRRIEHVDAEMLAALIGSYAGVVVDIGTGDGRWLYRLARVRPEVLCLGIDASAGGLREISYRAGRKPARGGLPNIRFIAAGVEALPGGLREVADEVWVVYPWGSLLRALLAPEPAVLRGIAAVLKPQGLFRAAINGSVLDLPAIRRRFGLPSAPAAERHDAIRAGYNEAGLSVTAIRSGEMRIRSSWGARLGQGAGVRTLWVEALRHGHRGDHGGGRNRAGTAGAGAAGASARGDRDASGVSAV